MDILIGVFTWVIMQMGFFPPSIDEISVMVNPEAKYEVVCTKEGVDIRPDTNWFYDFNVASKIIYCMVEFVQYTEISKKDDKDFQAHSEQFIQQKAEIVKKFLNLMNHEDVEPKGQKS